MSVQQTWESGLERIDGDMQQSIPSPPLSTIIIILAHRLALPLLPWAMLLPPPSSLSICFRSRYLIRFAIVNNRRTDHRNPV